MQNIKWPNLRAFAEWYLAQPFPHRGTTVSGKRVGAGSRGEILFRSGAFQTELVTFSPFHVVPPHRHPWVSCYDFLLQGTGQIILAGRALPHREPSLTLSSRIPVLAGLVHSGKAGPCGAVFLSVQHWHKGRADGYIIDDWAVP